MSWYRFKWQEFISDGLLRQMMQALSLSCSLAQARRELAPILEGLLTMLGGPPMTQKKLSVRACQQVATSLLHDALCHSLRSQSTLNVPGYLSNTPASGPAQIQAVARVRINEAPRAELEGLPHVGPELAQVVIDLRRQRSFADLTDFVDRVPGLGEKNVQAIASAITFETYSPRLTWQPCGDFESDLRSFINKPEPTLGEVTIAFERLLTLVRQEPAPLRRLPPDLPHAPQPSAPATLQADQVLVWPDSVYYTRLKEALASAKNSIDVCMFHIAMPVEKHPSKALLAALVAAHRRGLRVRVLVDADRPEDPYLSHVINENAVRKLSRQGVAVRRDSPERLLHSKFVLIDDEWTIMGSHNWSAGSFFQMDDLTLAIRSNAVSTAQRARFEGLWSAAG